MSNKALSVEGIDRYVAGVRPEFESMLAALVEVPTVSADPAHSGDIRKGAELALQYLRDFGASAELVEKPYLGEFHGAYADAARRSIQFAFGKEPAFIREGGSIGAVVTMREYLGLPITLIGLSLPEHGYHAPNEHYDWGQASGGIKALAMYFNEVSAITKG